MRLLGLDIGEARVGVAVSDSGLTIASPVAVLDGRRLARDIAPLRELVEEYEVSGLVIGLPLGMGGTEGAQAVLVRDIGTRFGHELTLPVTFVDERLSSKEASRAMSGGGVSSKRQRGRLDMVAAALILQTYLDGQRRAG
ncbi:MAG: Holliday junction resolvase RuvX [Actinomycetota bacterium]|nr:Holliday junction resolvase RuvX [Actinomycetota bacterium]MDP3630707.1 Holliday junction resolvase RuvX [Actinomycetota bacterium]